MAQPSAQPTAENPDAAMEVPSAPAPTISAKDHHDNEQEEGAHKVFSILGHEFMNIKNKKKLNGEQHIGDQDDTRHMQQFVAHMTNVLGDAISLFVTALTFLAGIAAAATAIDFDSHVVATEMYNALVVGQEGFRAIFLALMIAFGAYLGNLALKLWRPEALIKHISITRRTWLTLAIQGAALGVVSILCLIGIAKMVEFLNRTAAIRAQGEDICPDSPQSKPRDHSFCGGVGHDLYAAADEVCNTVNGVANGSYAVLCAELGKERPKRNNPWFKPTFVWNSAATNFSSIRSNSYFELVGEATDAYCHKASAWAERRDACGPPGTLRGSRTHEDRLLCAVARQVALAADDCQAGKRQDVEKCFNHCGAEHTKTDETYSWEEEFDEDVRPESSVALRIHNVKTTFWSSHYALFATLALAITMWGVWYALFWTFVKAVHMRSEIWRLCGTYSWWCGRNGCCTRNCQRVQQ